MKTHTEITNKATEIIDNICNLVESTCDIDLRNEGLEIFGKT